MNTVGYVVSTIKNNIKAVKQDAASLSDRFLYALILKHGKFLIRRQDDQNKLMMTNSIWQPLNVVKLITIDKADKSFDKLCVLTGCYIKRTENKIPKVMHGYYGPLLRYVTSIDGTIELEMTTQPRFERMAKQPNFKYNKKKYYWYQDDHLYFPNIEWDAIQLEGVFEGDITAYNDEEECIYIQNTICPIPEHLFSEIENLVKEDLNILLQIPPNQQHDNVNVIE